MDHQAEVPATLNQASVGDGNALEPPSLRIARAVPKEDVVSIGSSFLSDIGVVRLRHFVFPWGRV